MRIIQEVLSAKKDTTYIVNVEVTQSGLVDATCTCMWSTIELGRHPDFIDRKLCKHIKATLEAIKNPSKQKELDK